MTSKVTLDIELDTYLTMTGGVSTYLFIGDAAEPSLFQEESLLSIIDKEIEGCKVKDVIHPVHYEELEVLLNKLREASDYLWDQLMLSKKVEEAKEVLSKHKT